MIAADLDHRLCRECWNSIAPPEAQWLSILPSMLRGMCCGCLRSEVVVLALRDRPGKFACGGRHGK